MKRDQDPVFQKRVRSLERRLENSRNRIQELKQELKSLKGQIKQKDLILKHMPAWALMVQDQSVVWASGELLGELGWKEEEALGRPFLDLVHPKSREEAENIQGLGLERNPLSRQGKTAPKSYQLHIIARSGKALECELRIKKIRFKSRNAFLVGLIPLEEIKAKERERWLAEKLSASETMALGLARGLEKCLEELRSFGPTKEQMEALSSLELLARNLRLLGQREIRPDAKIFYLPEAIHQAQLLFQQKLEVLKDPEAVQFHTTFRAKSLIKGDPDQIRDMLLYILENSLEAVGKGGRIYLSVEEHQGMACIYIQDNGKGVPPELHTKIFDPCFTTSPEAHQGLGLTLAHAIARRHGGHILMDSCGGHGATFVVRLPLCQKAPSSKKRSWRKLLKDAKILLLSQDYITGDLLSELLKEKGAQVIAQFDPVKAIKTIRPKGVEVVVVDLAIGGMDPIAFVDLIRKEAAHIPIIFFVTRAASPSLSGLLEKGNITVVVKPFEMEQIFETIGEAVSRSRGKRQAD